MAAKSKILINSSKNLIDICKKQMTSKQGVLKESWMEGTNIAYKCKIFVAVI